MPGYAEFMMDMVKKERSVTRSHVQKKYDPGAFTILCNIGFLHFAKALCDLGASINLMPLSSYKNLGLGHPKTTVMRLLIVDRTLKRPLDLVLDVFVKLESFIFPNDFVIHDREVDFEVPFILRRQFPATGNFSRYGKSYNDFVAALKTSEYRSKLKKLEFYMMHHESPPVRPSIVEASKLELQDLPPHLRYVFLGRDDTLLVIIAAYLNGKQVEYLVVVLKRCK
ncbi:uncharacterized protein LOC107006498 [Solanum pennellii]|uniref:Uncharacterized protein LOC107006498 n=1 Tax=Solanum pennellii TaxID=28526 RepID=A0ABM1FR39_SOLPN|nr:uncharacterized protein LOC107006498 [Solanum pennellii]